jgi:hypothetical protein
VSGAYILIETHFYMKHFMSFIFPTFFLSSFSLALIFSLSLFLFPSHTSLEWNIWNGFYLWLLVSHLQCNQHSNAKWLFSKLFSHSLIHSVSRLNYIRLICVTQKKSSIFHVYNRYKMMVITHRFFSQLIMLVSFVQHQNKLIQIWVL